MMLKSKESKSKKRKLLLFMLSMLLAAVQERTRVEIWRVVKSHVARSQWIGRCRRGELPCQSRPMTPAIPYYFIASIGCIDRLAQGKIGGMKAG